MNISTSYPQNKLRNLRINIIKKIKDKELTIIIGITVFKMMLTIYFAK
jgi:translation initiation factor 1 (eIF-1/SUI1)